MLVELYGGPFDGERIEIEDVEHAHDCVSGCTVPVVEIENDWLGLKATYARCAICGTYEYIAPGDDAP